MKWPWQKEEPAPAPAGECKHLWSNWSAPASIDVKATYMPMHWSATTRSEEREGMSQDRYCLHCNMYERRLA